MTMRDIVRAVLEALSPEVFSAIHAESAAGLGVTDRAVTQMMCRAGFIGAEGRTVPVCPQWDELREAPRDASRWVARERQRYTLTPLTPLTAFDVAARAVLELERDWGTILEMVDGEPVIVTAAPPCAVDVALLHAQRGDS